MECPENLVDFYLGILNGSPTKNTTTGLKTYNILKHTAELTKKEKKKAQKLKTKRKQESCEAGRKALKPASPTGECRALVTMSFHLQEKKDTNPRWYRVTQRVL